MPAGARLKGKKVLQPADLITLFNTDTTLYRGKRVPDEYVNAYRFQVLTGLRPGELMGLQWPDIQGNTVHVQRAVNVRGEITGHQDSVFCITNEQHYYKRWKAYCTANGLTKVTPYELRHTFVSVVKTLPAGEVKGLVGHSLDMDTFGVYGHILTGEAEATAEAVEGTFLKILNNA